MSVISNFMDKPELLDPDNYSDHVVKADVIKAGNQMETIVAFILDQLSPIMEYIDTTSSVFQDLSSGKYKRI